ncbi:gag-pol polyprotein, partial [Trifolium medium]|nr:gag-pol polyprotein [Trifolium medium]
MSQCYKARGYPQKPKSPKQNKKKVQTQRVKKVWKAKTTTSNLAHTPLRIPSKEDWYFDSGCSKHMTRDKKYLKEVRTFSGGRVVFGDGAKGKVKGIGKLASP